MRSYSPGDEGKWFATAKELGLYDVAIALARKSPCDPKTLTRAARDFTEREPRLALEAGLTALYWRSLGQGYEITSIDVWDAYRSTLKMAEALGSLIETQQRIREMLEKSRADGFTR